MNKIKNYVLVAIPVCLIFTCLAWVIGQFNLFGERIDARIAQYPTETQLLIYLGVFILIGSLISTIPKINIFPWWIQTSTFLFSWWVLKEPRTFLDAAILRVAITLLLLFVTGAFGRGSKAAVDEGKSGLGKSFKIIARSLSSWQTLVPILCVLLYRDNSQMFIAAMLGAVFGGSLVLGLLKKNKII